MQITRQFSPVDNEVFQMRRLTYLSSHISTLGFLRGVSVCAVMAVSTASHAADQALVDKGRYLATAADCSACHTAPGGEPFAGGYPLKTPVGTIFSTNITPSSTGIGGYTKAEFSEAVRHGVARGGKRLYPVMPYTSYAGITDDDIDALYAYFTFAVAPVDKENRQNTVGFPFNIRLGMIFWNALYLDRTTFHPKRQEPAQIVRGRYLVDNLEHCGTCHTPRTMFMGPKKGQELSGSVLGAWYAPNITSDKTSGIADWSDNDLRNYLQTGHATNKGQAAGPMAEAIEHSIQFLTQDDIDAIIAYLRHVPAVIGDDKQPRTSFGMTTRPEDTLRGLTTAKAKGWKIFSGSCAACHQPEGEGLNAYPSLTHNSVTGAANAQNLVTTILAGVQRTTGETTTFMPAFGPDALWVNRLSDQDIADVSNFVLKTFGNPSVQIDASYVAKRRAELAP